MSPSWGKVRERRIYRHTWPRVRALSRQPFLRLEVLGAGSPGRHRWLQASEQLMQLIQA
jgi:hypothetical protein